MKRLILIPVAVVAFPLMFVGLAGLALWMAFDGDVAPITITKGVRV